MGTPKMLLLLVCMVFAISQASAPCPINRCNETHCCVRETERDPPECSPYLPLNAHCDEYNTQKNHVYIHSCPCELGLYCVNGRCGRFTRAIPRTTPATTQPDSE